MFRATIALLGVLFTVGFGVGVALADPHFDDKRTSVTLQSDGDLTVNWREVGLGNPTVDYTFSADASVTCVCVTHSGKCPSASNKATFSEALSGNGTFKVKNGNVTGSLTLAPGCPASAAPTCGGGQVFVLGQVDYTDLSLEDTTNTVFATGLPTSLSTGTLFTCP